MSDLQDHMTTFLRDSGAEDRAVAVQEDLFGGTHWPLRASMVEMGELYVQKIINAALDGDVLAIGRIVADLQMGHLCVGVAFGRYEVEKVLQKVWVR